MTNEYADQLREVLEYNRQLLLRCEEAEAALAKDSADAERYRGLRARKMRLLRYTEQEADASTDASLRELDEIERATCRRKTAP